MSSKQNIKVDHKMRVANCKGVLKCPRKEYGIWAYWYASPDPKVYGWYPVPRPANKEVDANG